LKSGAAGKKQGKTGKSRIKGETRKTDKHQPRW